MTITHAQDLVAAARGRIENLGDQELAAELELEDVVLVDLREQSERVQTGAIPHASHIPRGLLEFCADPTLPTYRAELDPDRRIVLYCAVGGRSALAAAALRDMGFPHVAHLDGGFERWRQAGRPVIPVKADDEAANKRLLEQVFAAFSEGNAQALLDVLAEDVRWTISGTTAWSGVYHGKQTILREVFLPVFSQYAEPYRSNATRFIADGEHVVVEARGCSTTKTGRSFNNAYCYVFHLTDAIVDEVVEYCDTLHVSETLRGAKGNGPTCGPSH
jgi:ketosteroid isomerase-like protein/rhodanese-related sulfurtransferase